MDLSSGHSQFLFPRRSLHINRSLLTCLIIPYYRLVCFVHERRRHKEISCCPIAGYGHIVEHGNPQQGLHIHVVRMRLHRVLEKDDRVDLAFGDQGAQLLIATQRAGLQTLYVVVKVLFP